MEKFEKVLSLFIKNPYRNVELSDSYKVNFKDRFFTIFILFPSLIFIFSLMGYFPINLKIEDNYPEFKQFYFLMYFYKYLCIAVPVFYVTLIKNYFHMKYKLLSFRASLVYFAISFFILLIFLPFNLLFLIEDIKPTTICIYYLTAIILLIIYSIYYNQKWYQNIFIDNYNKYKKDVLKPTFGEDSLIGKFQLNLEKNEKSVFTKIWEWVATIMLRFMLTIPVLAAIFGSGIVTNYEISIYFCIYMFLFMIPFFAKTILSGVVFLEFLKQIEKEENVTIYNGRVKN